MDEAQKSKNIAFAWFELSREDQARGIYGLRRDGENTKTVESKAAATGAKIALIADLFKLCGFIFFIAFVIFKFCANYCIKFNLCKKNVICFVD